MRFKKELKNLETSERALNMTILSLILASINVNKSKIETLDKINGTNYADKSHDFKTIKRLSKELGLIGSSIALDLSKNKLKDKREEFNKNNDNLEIKNKFEEANKSYIVSLLYFLGAFIS